MTKQAAIHDFLSGFELTAYPAMSIPTEGDTPAFPYLTYSLPIGAEFDKLVMTASLWYRSDSWLDVNAKATEISIAIGYGRVLPCEGGALIIRRGSPFVQPMGDDSDDKIKRNVLQMEVTFVTTH